MIKTSLFNLNPKKTNEFLNMEKNFYISTPLYYVNDKPHLGTAYTTVIADILNRYQKFFGRSTFFITGTDEHGQKCALAAKKQNLSPQEHCDFMRKQFQKAWDILNIQYDLFFYTTHKYPDTNQDNHSSVVQKVLQKLFDKGDIYSAEYKGWYCVSEEIFYTEKDLVEGKSPTGKPVVFLEEKAWFFKMSQYQKQLKSHLKKYPQFIKPKERQNEILGFLKKPLQDLCISRPKSRVSWGVELPFDTSQVVYVWVDALLNYIVGAGYLSGNEKERREFKENWEEAETLHLIGKDILMTHAVYWSSLLLALELPLPKKILAHGWLLNKESEKMSKSKGDKLEPLELSEELGVDSLRWFLAKEIPLGKDSAISKHYMIQKTNEQLADNLGNILSRVSKLINKNFEGDISQLRGQRNLQSENLHSENSQPTNPQSENPQPVNTSNPLKLLIEKQIPEFQKQINSLQLSQALSGLCVILSEINRYLEKEPPWKTVKTDKAQAGLVLYNSLEALRICTILIHPVMPQKTKELLSFLGEKPEFKNIQWGRLPLGKKLQKAPIFFPKIQIKT